MTKIVVTIVNQRDKQIHKKFIANSPLDININNKQYFTQPEKT